MSDADWLTDEVVAAIRHHMNTDHADDNVVICQGIGGLMDVLQATFVDLDVDGANFLATTPNGDVPIRVLFTKPLESRSDARTEIAALYNKAAELVAS